MEKSSLTANQRKVLEFIVKNKAKTGNSPTIIEIKDHFGFKAIGSVQDYLEVLQKKGYIKRSSKARDIEVLDSLGIEIPAKDTVRLPILGQIAAGSPILAQENLSGHLHVDKSMIRSKSMFLLKVRGESMKNAHILDGDMVVVHPQKDCENGDIAVCLLEEEATVKRFFKKQNHIELKPENETMKPIIVKSGEPFSVIGKVTGVIRLNL